MPNNPSSRPAVLQHGRLLPGLEQALAEQFDLHPLWSEADPVAFLAREGARFTGLATSARFGADAALLAALPNLRVISSFGVGYETLDVAAARARGIAMGYTPSVLDDCVADTAFGLVIDVARRFSAADRFTRSGAWLKGQFALGTKVSGKRLGIVGLGRIGATIARRASGFDMEVRYHNRNARSDVSWQFEPSLADLAHWADFLVVAAAGGAGSQHLINAHILRALGLKGFLINIARGSVVDEAALVAALQRNEIAGAGLDVYADEPQVPPALRALDNVVLLPHIASATHETRQAMADLVLANLQAFFATGQVRVAIPA